MRGEAEHSGDPMELIVMLPNLRFTPHPRAIKILSEKFDPLKDLGIKNLPSLRKDTDIN